MIFNFDFFILHSRSRFYIFKKCVLIDFFHSFSWFFFGISWDHRFSVLYQLFVLSISTNFHIFGLLFFDHGCSRHGEDLVGIAWKGLYCKLGAQSVMWRKRFFLSYMNPFLSIIPSSIPSFFLSLTLFILFSNKEEEEAPACSSATQVYWTKRLGYQFACLFLTQFSRMTILSHRNFSWYDP